jgi:hypothetical protein
MKHISVNPNDPKPPTRDYLSQPETLPIPQDTKTHPTRSNGDENASLMFVGNATTIISFAGARIMTDPNFLHAGDHVHLGPGAIGTRITDPAFDLHELPHVDAVLLSHYHADHFDQKVENSLRRDLPIITTPHARRCLVDDKPTDEFTAVTALDCWDSCFVDIETPTGEQSHAYSEENPAVKVTGMPGKHVPAEVPDDVKAIAKAVPPTNGWMVEIGYGAETSFSCGYRLV